MIVFSMILLTALSLSLFGDYPGVDVDSSMWIFSTMKAENSPHGKPHGFSTFVCMFTLGYLDLLLFGSIISTTVEYIIRYYTLFVGYIHIITDYMHTKP